MGGHQPALFFELEQRCGAEVIQRHITTYISSNRANIRSSYAMSKIDCQGKFRQKIGSLLIAALSGPPGSTKAKPPRIGSSLGMVNYISGFAEPSPLGKDACADQLRNGSEWAHNQQAIQPCQARGHGAIQFARYD